MAMVKTKSGSKLTPELQKLVEENMWCVTIIALQLCRRLPLHVMVEDLVSAGYLGMVECAPRYDGRCLFRTFASGRIKGAMLDYLRGEDLLTRWERRSETEIERAEVPINYKVLAIPEAVQSAGKLSAGIDARRMLGKLKQRHPRSAFVIEQHYLRGRPRLLIAKELGVSPSRLSQIESAALANMRAAA